MVVWLYLYKRPKGKIKMAVIITSPEGSHKKVELFSSPLAHQNVLSLKRVAIDTIVAMNNKNKYLSRFAEFIVNLK